MDTSSILDLSRAPFPFFLKLASLLRNQLKSVHIFPGRFLDIFIIANDFFLQFFKI